MTNNHVENNCIAHFLRQSGSGEVTGRVHMLLLAATKRLTSDIRELNKEVRPPPEKLGALERTTRKIKEIVAAAFSTRPLDVVDSTEKHSRGVVDVLCHGSHVYSTALADSALDITVITNDNPRARYYWRSLRDNVESMETVESLLLLPVKGTEAAALQPYPASLPVTLPLLERTDMLQYLSTVISKSSLSRVSINRHSHNTFERICLGGAADEIGMNLTVNQRDSVEACGVLRQFLRSNEPVRHVIILMKVILKQLHIHSSQLTPYVLTLMVVAFSRHCANEYPLCGSFHYPHRRNMVESGYLLLSFLSFFSPPPRGLFTPTDMLIVPMHPDGIIKRSTCVPAPSPGECVNSWKVMDPICHNQNVAASCSAIDQCPLFFERILNRLLCGYLDASVLPLQHVDVELADGSNKWEANHCHWMNAFTGCGRPLFALLKAWRAHKKTDLS
ncbi:hypothetical protein, conserved [Trypanosoma brucei brucei TREU927]|uniref:Uncharacterized protein n=1 Tax=Trypanosoma brucei brucei (strain 927/4 GUTat10.1) TaxID=185431 RepID=Q584D0_TRYB2|nr:hypothetical protein, conserved [Trypanosoma brucei brucei TREU927]AAX79075.1 hypothetical protein, conserved [Trypanosoma brucei]AAZ10848.1 hypothetical protein, conserved [Trypanosoma brucei brucei TREU927]